MDTSIIEKDFPKKEKLKDGTTISLRLMTLDDKKLIMDFFSTIGNMDKLYMRENVSDPESVECYWLDRIKEGTCITVLAFIKDKLAGEAALHQAKSFWSSHVGYIRINIGEEFRGRGLATELANEIFHIAVKLKLEKVCAEIVSEQKKALDIFKRLEFKKEAVLHNHVKDLKGDLHDLIILSNNTSILLESIKTHLVYHDMHLGQEY